MGGICQYRTFHQNKYLKGQNLNFPQIDPFPKFEIIVITLSNDEYWIRHNSGSIKSLTLLPQY